MMRDIRFPHVCRFAAACGLWLCAATALAQSRDPYVPPGSASYPRGVFVGPTVSPYVNLGTNTTGVSNYHSFVRPLVEQREAQRAQSEAQQASRRLAHDTRLRGQPAKSAAAEPHVRFMHYPHFFRGIR